MTSSPLRRSRAACDDRDRFVDLGFRRHQRGAIGERPAVILRMRHFEPARAKLDRKIDERGDLMNIRAMDDRVDGQRHAGLGHVTGEGALALPRALVMAEAVVGLLVRALEGELRMVEAGVDQLAGPASRSPRCLR